MPKNSIHSKTANQENRDEYGKFIKVNPPISIPPPNSLNAPNPPNLLTKLWQFLSKLSLKKIALYISYIYFAATSSYIGSFVEQFFPTSSPVLHRVVAHQGLLKTSGSGVMIESIKMITVTGSLALKSKYT